MGVSLCMIVRDEAARIRGCLDSIRHLVQEMIVVDTGSKDETRSLALSQHAHVFDFAWCDDFSAARNESLRHASHPWVFWLDADDLVDPENQKQLKRLFGALGDENAGYMMQCTSITAGGGLGASTSHLRLFRNDPNIRWKHRVHEQVAPCIQARGGELRRADVVIHHYGYADPRVAAQKSERNLHLSELECAEEPVDSFAQFCRGWALADLGRHSEALVALNLSACAGLPGGAASRKLYALLARCYTREQLLWPAMQAVKTGRMLYPDDLELLFMEARVRASGQDFARAEECVRLALGAPLDEWGECTDASLVGSQGQAFLALLCALQGKYAEAEEEARASLGRDPTYGPAWIVLADSLAGRDRMEQIESLLETPHMPTGARVAIRAYRRVANKEFAAAAAELNSEPASTDALVDATGRWLAQLTAGCDSKHRPIDILRVTESVSV